MKDHSQEVRGLLRFEWTPLCARVASGAAAAAPRNRHLLADVARVANQRRLTRTIVRLTYPRRRNALVRSTVTTKAVPTSCGLRSVPSVDGPPAAAPLLAVKQPTALARVPKLPNGTP
jgi:hypothetical protein